jgi:predicted phage terminase large subunit-like protein
VFQSFPKDPASAGVYQVADLVKILEGIPHEFTPESGDKEARATPFASQVETRAMIGRKVKLLRGHWNKHYLDLMSSFPKGRYKDTTDAQSRSYGALITRKESSPVSTGGMILTRGGAMSEHSNPWGHG